MYIQLVNGDANNLLIDKDELKKKLNTLKLIGVNITYHGPSLMAYPIFDLDNFFTDINYI